MQPVRLSLPLCPSVCLLSGGERAANCACCGHKAGQGKAYGTLIRQVVSLQTRYSVIKDFGMLLPEVLDTIDCGDFAGHKKFARGFIPIEIPFVALKQRR